MTVSIAILSANVLANNVQVLKHETRTSGNIKSGFESHWYSVPYSEGEKKIDSSWRGIRKNNSLDVG